MSIFSENFTETLPAHLYAFSNVKRSYNFTPSNIGFFQPFENKYDFQQQLKSTLLSPILALSFSLHIIEVLQHLLGIGVGVLCLDGSLIQQDFEDTVLTLVRNTVGALSFCLTTLGSALSLLTRSFATISGLEVENDYLENLGQAISSLFSLPDNPYENEEQANDDGFFPQRR